MVQTRGAAVHTGASSGSGTGCVHAVGSEADFPGGKFQARPARRGGHVVSLLCPGKAYCAARSAPTWLLLVRERSWSSVGTWTGQHSAGRAGCLSWGLRSGWVGRPAGSLCRAPPACCPGPEPAPGERPQAGCRDRVTPLAQRPARVLGD